MINCPNCHTPNRAGARFCMGCGTRLDVELPTGAVPAPAAPAPRDDAAPPLDTPATPGATPPPALPVAEPAPLVAEPAPAMDVPPAAVPAMDVPPAAVPAAIDLPSEPALPPEPADSAEAASLAASIVPPVPTGSADAASLAVPSVPLEPVAAPALAPLAAGAVIGGRFTVVDLLEDKADGHIYRATDADACAQCGASIVPGDKFCGDCGAEITGPAVVRLHETTEAPQTAAVEAGGRWYAVLPPDATVPQTVQPQHGWRLQVGQASDAGKVRDLDEDSIFSLVLSGIYESQIETTVGLFLVADGIGGQEGGEVASKLAAQTIAQQVLQRIIWPILRGETLLVETLQEELQQAVQGANRQVYDLRRERSNDMGTTLTMVLLINGLAIIGNVGDSRTYVWGPKGLEQLTEDHSLIAALIAAGQEPPEAIYTHPQRNLITRSLGDSPHVDVDLFKLELEPGFRLILCCDGVWEMIRNEGIEEVMLQEDHAQQAADKIVAWSNEAGGEDNISVVVVTVEQV